MKIFNLFVYENTALIDADLQTELKEKFIKTAADAKAIIISDCNCGVANRELAEVAKRIAVENKIPLLVDSRFNLRNFHGATTATPNQDEVEQILGANYTEQACVKLCKNFNYESLLITRGNQGMLLIKKNKPPLHIKAVGSEEPVDVTGAGDR